MLCHQCPRLKCPYNAENNPKLGGIHKNSSQNCGCRSINDLVDKNPWQGSTCFHHLRRSWQKYRFGASDGKLWQADLKNLGFRVLEEKILKKKTTCGFLPTALVNFLNGGHNLSYVNMGSARMCMVAELMKSIIECMNEWILENSDFTIGWLFTAWDYKLQNSYSRLFNMGLRESILNPMFFSPHWAPLPHHHLEHPAARAPGRFCGGTVWPTAAHHLWAARPRRYEVFPSQCSYGWCWLMLVDVKNSPRTR